MQNDFFLFSHSNRNQFEFHFPEFISHAQSFVGVFIVFFGKLNDFDQTTSKLFQYFALRCFSVAVIFKAIVGLRNDTLYRRLNHIGRYEIAWFFRRNVWLGFDFVVAAATDTPTLLVRSLYRLIHFVVRTVAIIVVHVIIDVATSCRLKTENLIKLKIDRRK